MIFDKINSPTLAVLKREFRRIAERKTIYVISVVAPIILFTLFASIYKYEIPRKLPIAICDQDRTETSRLAIKYLESSSAMDIKYNVHSVDSIKELFWAGKIYGAFYFPENMETSLKNGKSTNVIIFKGAANIITANYVYNDGYKICKMISAGGVVKKIGSAGFSAQQAMNIANPIRVQAQILFNPNYSYENYLVPGLMVAILQMIIMMVAAIIISSELTHDTFNQLVTVAQNRVMPIVIGKSIPHLFLHMATSLMIFGILFTVFNIPINGNIIYVMLFMFFFVAAAFFYGFFISVICKDQQMATEAALFINTPAFIFSGFTFPIWGMPLVHQIYAQTIPLTHFLNGFLKLYQMNTPVHYVWPEIIKLSMFLFVALAGTIIILKVRILKINKTKAREITND